MQYWIIDLDGRKVQRNMSGTLVSIPTWIRPMSELHKILLLFWRKSWTNPKTVKNQMPNIAIQLLERVKIIVISSKKYVSVLGKTSWVTESIYAKARLWCPVSVGAYITYRKHSIRRKTYHDYNSVLEALPVTSHTKQNIAMHLFRFVWNCSNVRILHGNKTIKSNQNQAKFTKLHLPQTHTRFSIGTARKLYLQICLGIYLCFAVDK